LLRKPPTRVQLVRDHLTPEIRPVRSLLSALMICHCRSGLKSTSSHSSNVPRRALPPVAKAVEAGELRVDDELHLTPLAASAG